jgi:hypothetical protein
MQQKYTITAYRLKSEKFHIRGALCHGAQSSRVEPKKMVEAEIIFDTDSDRFMAPTTICQRCLFQLSNMRSLLPGAFSNICKPSA